MSARAVSVWTWRHALRDHAPGDLLLTLYTIGVYMDGDGVAYPSQESIAAGARVCVRTVQRHIAEAKSAGWLGVELAGRVGQDWRHNKYRAAVPDDLQLEREELKVADAITAKWGRIEGDDTAMSPRSNGDDTAMSPRSNGDDTAMSPRSAGNAPALPKGDDTGGVKVTTNRAKADDTGDAKVTTQLCRTNSCSETPASRTHTQRKHTPTRKAASGVPTPPSMHSGKKETGTKPARKGAPSSAESAAPVSAADVQVPKIAGRQKIEKLLRLKSDLPDGDIARIAGEPIELVAEVRRALQSPGRT